MSQIRSVEKARVTFSNSSSILQHIDGKFTTSQGMVVIHATGKKFIESGELVYVGKLRNLVGDCIADKYEYREK